MALVQIPLSNTLRMVRTDDQSTNLQNFDNRLLSQEDYEDYNDRFYAQKIASTDTILVQFATDYSLGVIEAKVYNLDGTEASDETSNISSVLVSTSFTVYDLSFSVAAEGQYYLEINFDSGTEVYQSEVFQIDGFDTGRMLKIEYNTSDNDGIVYNNNQTFIIRLEGRLAEYKAGQDKETYQNYNKSLTNLNSYPIREVMLEYGFVPRFMAEKLNLALAHELFKVNDVEYQSDGAPNTDILKDGVVVTNMYKGGVKLQQVDYENYTEASDDVPLETDHILIDEFTTKIIAEDQGTEYFVRYKD